VHQFLAQHFDYVRNLVVIDLLAVKHSHCGFMVLLCNEAEKTRVENSKVLAVDGSTHHSNAIPTDLLFFDDLAGGMVHYPADELDENISEKVSKKWLFMRIMASICLAWIWSANGRRRNTTFFVP
jgi:hypothetical protein